MSTPIKQYLTQFISQQSDWKITLISQWRTIMGELHEHVELMKINGDTAVLGVMDACWMQELHLLSSLIIERINKNLDQPHIKQLRFMRKGITRKPHNSRATIVRKKSATRPLTSREQTALSRISDTELSAVLERFLQRCNQER